MVFLRLKSDTAFTLIELLVVVAVISILASIAVPGFSSWVQKYRIDSAALEIASVFETGKVQAVKRGKNVYFSVDTNGNGVRDNGYCLYLDQDDNNKVSAGDKIIERKLFEHVEYNMSETTVDSGHGPIRFYSKGRAKGGTIAFKDTSGNGCKVSLSLLGKVKIKK